MHGLVQSRISCATCSTSPSLPHAAATASLSLDGFWIDRTEATNARYQKGVEDGACDPPTPCNVIESSEDAYDDAGKLDRPVVCASLKDTAVNCHWAGKRLPSGAEWEKACRGPDERLRPWGDEWDATEVSTAESRIPETTRVGGFPGGASHTKHWT